MTTSFDAPLLAPQAFFARTRTKYVPDPTPVAVYDVAGLCVSKFARFAAPGADPASITYDALPPLGACQLSTTVDPATSKPNAGGGATALEHGAPAMPTPTITSFDAALMLPSTPWARMRT